MNRCLWNSWSRAMTRAMTRTMTRVTKVTATPSNVHSLARGRGCCTFPIPRPQKMRTKNHYCPNLQSWTKPVDKMLICLHQFKVKICSCILPQIPPPLPQVNVVELSVKCATNNCNIGWGGEGGKPRKIY